MAGVIAAERRQVRRRLARSSLIDVRSNRSRVARRSARRTKRVRRPGRPRRSRILLGGGRRASRSASTRSTSRRAAISRLEGTGASAQSPDVSPDGAVASCSSATPPTDTICSRCRSAGARWTADRGRPLVTPRRAAIRRPAPRLTSTPARPTPPWRTLPPRFWTPTSSPTTTKSSSAPRPGRRTRSGARVRRRGRMVGASRGRTGRSRTPTTAGGRPSSSPFATTPIRGATAKCGRARSSAGVLLSVSRASGGRSRCSRRSRRPATRSTARVRAGRAIRGRDARAPLRLGWRFSNAQDVRLLDQRRRRRPLAATAEIDARRRSDARRQRRRAHRRCAPLPARVAAPRVRRAARAAAAAPGATRPSRACSAPSGHGPQPAGFDFGIDAIGLLRGFDEDAVVGPRGGREPRLPRAARAGRARRSAPFPSVPAQPSTARCSPMPATPGRTASAGATSGPRSAPSFGRHGRRLSPAADVHRAAPGGGTAPTASAASWRSPDRAAF